MRNLLRRVRIRLIVWTMVFLILSSGCMNVLADDTTFTNTAPVKVASFGYHSLMFKDNGTVWSWGINEHGELGDGTTANKSIPVQVSLSNIISVSGGLNHSLALKNDNTVWAWGYNGYGQLGDGTTTNKNTPVQVTNLSGVIAVASGGNHSLALKNDGTVWAWGHNGYGQLGNGTTTPRSTPVQVSGLSGITAIAAGDIHSLALKNDGTVWAWGSNSGGALGDGTGVDKTTPVQISSLSGIIAISGGAMHSMALKNDGTVCAWGWGASGQNGDGTIANRFAPVQVSGLYGISAISDGIMHCLALKNDGTVWSWGNNSSGQLGDGTIENKNTPVQVSGLNNIKAISGGYYHSMAIKADGTIWSWGSNSYGQLGNGTNTSSLTPVRVFDLSFIGGEVEKYSGTNAKARWITDGDTTGVTYALGVFDANNALVKQNPWTANTYDMVTDLVTNTTYNIKVKARNEYGAETAWYTLGSATTTIVPPTNINKTVYNTAIIYTWDQVPSAFAYDVEIDGNILNTTSTTYKQSGLSPDTQHTFRVRSKTRYGVSAWSVLLQVKTTNVLPAIPQVIYQKASDTEITIAWGELPEATSYDVEVDDRVINTGRYNYCTLSNLTPSTPYKFRLLAKSDVGDGGWSSFFTVSTYSLGTPKDINIEKGDTQLKISWVAVPNATDYILCIDGTETALIQSCTYTKTDLSPETMHKIKIKAVNGANTGSWTEEMSILTLPLKPAVPEKVNLLAAPDLVTLRWDAVTDATGYDVEIDGAIIDNDTSMIYADEELEPNTVHTFRVRARNMAMVGDWSNTMTVTTLPGKPKAPGSILISNLRNLAEISWNNVAGALSYEILIDGELDKNGDAIDSTKIVNVGSESFYTHRRLVENMEHRYRIRTISLIGTSKWGGEIINNAIMSQCRKNKTVDLGLTASDIIDFSKYTLVVTYDPNVMDIADLSTLSGKLELAAGKVEGTDIEIKEFKPGRIVFTVSKVLNTGESWTGVINSIKFKAKVTGGTSITYTVYSQPEDFE